MDLRLEPRQKHKAEMIVRIRTYPKFILIICDSFESMFE